MTDNQEANPADDGAGAVAYSLPLMRDRLYLGEDGRGHGSRHGPQHDTLVEELWVDGRSTLAV